MSSSITRRREAKAKRRKQRLAERRRQSERGAGSSLAARVRGLAQAPIECCQLQEGLFENGMGALVLVRGTSDTGLVMACFLLDAFCLGVKDVILEEIEAPDLDMLLRGMEVGAPLQRVEPAYARKLLRDVVAYARSLGMQPPPEYAVAEQLFGDVSADACDEQFEFGHGGRPLYIPGETETRAQVRQRLDRLRRTVGEGGFDFRENGEADEDFALLAEEGALKGYDPSLAPDPTEWLELDEDERRLRVAYAHREEDFVGESSDLHATLHVVVENQLAENNPPAAMRALTRLMAEGLDRHEALHAIGRELIEWVYDAAKGAIEPSNGAYSAALERLTAESWRRKLEADVEEHDGADSVES